MNYRSAFVYSTDENYVKLTAVSIHSLLKHNPGANIVILANEVRPDSAAFLEKLVTTRGGTFEPINVADKLSQIKKLGANQYLSFSAYSRFFISDLLGDKYDRCVYIDGDTIVTDNLNELLALGLNGKPFAIGYDCIHVAYKKMIGLAKESPYYNSGVLLIDLKEWARRECAKRVLKYMGDTRASFMFGDQDFFSLVLADDAAHLPPRYNFLTHFQMFKHAADARYVTEQPVECWYGDEEFEQAQAKPAIHHFLGNTLGRPWHRESKNPLRPPYKALASEAEVCEVAEQSRPLDFSYRVQWLCWKLLPYRLFLFACRAMYRYFFRSRYGV